MVDVSQQSVDEWKNSSAVIRDLVNCKETFWWNDQCAPSEQAFPDVGLSFDDVQAASDRLGRFAPYLATVFPETSANKGLIESHLCFIPDMQLALNERYDIETQGILLLKMDNELPIAGSIKARGGIYEVLVHAEVLALEHGLLRVTDNYRRLADTDCRALFSQYRIAVGSTGNLGLSIGIMGAKLGFQATVHMSADAKAWKKELLRRNGVEVVEYASDYSAAVARGRQQAESESNCYFVDDETQGAVSGYASRAAVAPTA